MSSVQPAAITASTRSACRALIRLRRGLNIADSVAMLVRQMVERI
jgi:hypothetical protein